MEHPAELTDLSPQASKIIAPNAPVPLKMMAASGMAPLGPSDLISVLYVFSYSSDKSLKDKATATLIKLPDAVLLNTLAGLKNKIVLDGLAFLLILRTEALEKIILNQNVDDETVSQLAKKLNNEKLLEIIAANEQRLLRYPQIIENLYLNKNARMSTVDRAIELAVRNGVDLTGVPGFEEAKKAIEGELVFEPSDEPTIDDIAFSAALAQNSTGDIDHNEVLEVLEAKEKGLNVSTEKEKKVVSLTASLSGLTASQKVRMAMLGNSSQRSVLIRDSNKLVIMAVLKSPALNESEILRYSKAKSLPEEAIRFIASKRDWTKHYGVKLNLVNNPKTPVQDALKFLNHLRPNDLRFLERSKEVSSVVKNAAKELRKKRTK
jgi:hypothetical protein